MLRIISDLRGSRPAGPRTGRARITGGWTLLTALLLAGCASVPRLETSAIPQVEQLAPLPAETGQTQPVELGKLILKVPRGRLLGTIQQGHSCVGQKPLSWENAWLTATDADFGATVRQQLAAAGYAVAGDPDALFEDPHGPKAQYAIGGVIQDLKVNACYEQARQTSRGTGEASLAVEWQVYSYRTQTVELKMTTNGSSQLRSEHEGAVAELISEAFLSASRNLLADTRFHELLASRAVTEPPSDSARQPIAVAFPKRQIKPGVSVESMIGDSRMAVVTIFTDDAMGSGFVISPDGYLLTAQHVVGKTRYVRVRFLTGREVNGEVVRVDRVRDVALIKLEADLYRYLPLGESSMVAPGSEVFSIGTPVNDTFGQTVSRGIVSGYGQERGQRTLRSDVSVHRGSSGGPLLDRSGTVVAMTVSGLLLLPEGLGVGLNQFIPIEDALAALTIRQSESH
jgi:serine protease Do